MRLGKNKQTAIPVFFLLISTFAAGQTGGAYKYSSRGDVKESAVISDEKSVTINYSLSELNIKETSFDNTIFYRLSAPGHFTSTRPGEPELPLYCSLIEIPEGADWKVFISNVKSERINPARKGIKGILYPAQESEAKQDKRVRTGLTFNKALYSTHDLLNADTIKVEILGKIRGRQLANLIISPVRYNPGTNSLELITSMKIEIKFNRDAQITALPVKGESALFYEPLNKAVLNYNPDDVITGYSDQPVEMIILTDTTYRKFIEPLLLWKTQKGYKLKVLFRGKGLAGETFTEIKQTLSTIYNSSSADGHPPEYLLIIGDVTKIPFYGTGNITDMYYGEFDGNGDYLPDMFIGRIPANDTNAVKSAVNKIIQYESFNFADTNTFYSRALVATGKDDGYSDYMNGQVRYAINNYLTAANRINNYHFYYPDGYTKKDSIMKLIKNGLSFINYTGHGSSAGWLHLEIKSSDVAKMGNSNMYPFIISNACRTAQFSDTLSFGNKIMNGVNKGAIGFIGCSNDSYWDEDFYWIIGACTPGADPTYAKSGLGAYDRLFHTHGEAPSDWYITMGQVNYAGNLSVSSSASQKKKYYWETYTLLGDPSLIPIMGKPTPFTMVLPDTLPNGIKSLSLTVDPFAYVGVSHSDTLWDASFASPSGSVVLDLPGLSEDSCLVVITGQNKIPVIKTIHFSNINREFLNLSGTILNDSGGNNNGKADFGETLFLDLKISNLGLIDATNLSATISSTSPWVTISNSSFSTGTLPAGQEMTISNHFQLTIGKDVPDLGIITINLLLKDDRFEKRFKIDITLHSPRLEIINCIFDDSETGNNNYVADQGETFRLIFQVRNYGTSNTSGDFFIDSDQSDLTVLDPSVKSGVLQFGEVTDIPVLVKLSDMAPFGGFISVSSSLDCNPYFVEKDFSFRVGRIRESFEASSFRVFPWINMSSRPWTINRTISAEGNLSAQSGAITHNGVTNLLIRTYFTKADTLKFFYKVSSELNYDYLEFRLNDTTVFKKSGEIDWERRSVAVRPGINKMEWIYKKDNSVSQGSDCAWLDLIDFSISSPVTYIQRDLSVETIVSPVQKDFYGKEPVTVKVFNMGKDTLNGFFLGYTINNNIPVRQFFDERVFPYKDTVTVTFDRSADLALGGTYDISIFGYDNQDDYLRNDTLSISVENMTIEETMSVYPNPFTDKITVVLNSKENRKVRITITGISGLVITDIDRALVPGENRIIIDTGKFTPSMYLLRIITGSYEKVYPLVRMKE